MCNKYLKQMSVVKVRFLTQYKKYVLSNSESVQCNFFICNNIYTIFSVTLKQYENLMIFRRYDITIFNMAAVRHLEFWKFSFLIMWRSSSSKSAAVYKVSSKSAAVFTELWRYIDFKNGGRPPSWNCFTTIRDHPRSLCCWPQLPVKFHVNLIHRSENIAIWIFRIFGLKCLFTPPKMGVMGDFGNLHVIIHHWDPQKAHPCSDVPSA